MAAGVDSLDQNLISARMLLQTSLDKSRTLASALEETGPRLEEMKQRLPSLEAAVRPLRSQKWGLSAASGHINRAVRPATAVLKVFDAIHGLEKSLRREPCSDLLGYLLSVKRLEEALRFLAQNCGLAMRWLEDVVEFLKDNAVADDNRHRYLSGVTMCLKILRELQGSEERARLDGGLLTAAFDKIEAEFRRILREHCVPLPIISSESAIVAPSSLPVSVIQKLQAVIERLSANNRLENCISGYIDVRISIVTACLEPLGLEYLEMSVYEFDNLQDAEICIERWSKHLDYAVKNLFELEYHLCNEVFKSNRSTVSTDCFARIAIKSGFLAFIQFGNTITESKKDAVKLFKLLKIFNALNKLRPNFSRLFGGKSCVGIQTPTRKLVKRIVHGACEIFWELLPQVEVHRGTPPPPNGGVPTLVCFVAEYCNQLLRDDFRIAMRQVLEIQHNWQQRKFQEGLLREEVRKIMQAIRLNLDEWSKAYEDASFSHIFLMNNHSHLYNALKGTCLGDLEGESQLREHEKSRDYYASIYVKENWGMLPGLLGHEDIDTLSLSGGRTMIKKKLKAFHEALDRTYKKQSNRNLIVADESLRKRTCHILVDAIVPVYVSYVQKYGHLIEEDGIRHVTPVYTEEGLVHMLSSMFQPAAAKMGKCYSSTKTRHSIDKMMGDDRYNMAQFGGCMKMDVGFMLYVERNPNKRSPQSPTISRTLLWKTMRLWVDQVARGYVGCERKQLFMLREDWVMQEKVTYANDNEATTPGDWISRTQ